MFPLSGRLEAASKSNSSTLEPSRITTRVSSGWLASISMRFFMEFSGARKRARLAVKGEGRWRHCWGQASPSARLKEGAGKPGLRCVGHKYHLNSTPRGAGRYAGGDGPDRKLGAKSAD